MQLHISDSLGANTTGEGLMLAEGEVPIISILCYIVYNANEERQIQGTIELEGGAISITASLKERL